MLSMMLFCTLHTRCFSPLFLLSVDLLHTGHCVHYYCQTEWEL